MTDSSQQQNCCTTLNDSASNTITIDLPSSPDWNTMIGSSNYYTTTYTTSNTDRFPFYNKNGEAVVSITSDSDAALKVTGDIVLNGDSLKDRLERIETILSIPTRDVTIEEQYPKLKKLYEQYMAELEKCKTWNRLKKGTER